MWTQIAHKSTNLKWTLDWAGDKDDRRSISGYMIFLNDVLICWRSKAQQTVALSSSEAEFFMPAVKL